MTRKMAYIGFSYLAGLFLASFFISRTNFIIALFLITAATLLLIFKNNYIKVIVCLISVSVAVINYGIYDSLIYDKIILSVNKNTTLTGMITDVRDYSGDMSLYTFKGKVEGIPTTISFFAESTQCNYNDKVTVRGVLTKPKNTLDFKSESYNKSIGKYIQFDTVDSFEITKNNSFSLVKEINSYKDYIFDKIDIYLPKEEGDLVKAMTFGEVSSLDSTTKKLMYRAGIGHIMSVSGTHLAVVSCFIMLILSQLKLKKSLAFIINEIAVIGFILLSGCSISVIRSGVMITILYLATLFKRRSDTLNSLGISIIILTLFSPFAVRDSSLILSISGVIGISVVAPYVNSLIKYNKVTGILLKPIVTMLAISVTTFPLTVFFFDEISIISPIANIVLIPFCTLALICCLIIVVTGAITIIASPLFLVIGLCGKIVISVCKFVGTLSFSFLPLDSELILPSILIILAGAFICLIIFKSRRKLIATTLTSLLLLLVATNVEKVLIKDELTLTYLTEKNSSNIILHMDNSAVIIELNNGKNMSYTVNHYLKLKGISRVDFIVLDENPQTSLSSFNENLILTDVKSYLVYEEFSSAINTSTSDLNIIPYGENSIININNYQLNISKNNIIIEYKDTKMTIDKEDMKVSLNNDTYQLDKSFTFKINLKGKIQMKEVQSGLR